MEGIEVEVEVEKRKPGPARKHRHVSPTKPETRIKNPPTRRVQALQIKKEAAQVVEPPKIPKPRIRLTEPNQILNNSQVQ